MITLKSTREIDRMRPAGALVAQAHRLLRKKIAPGVTTAELDAIVEQLFAEHDATPLFKGYPGKVPFPACTCISVNEEIVHGIPGDRVLQDGDIISVDTGCRLNGWCGDAAWTWPVGSGVDAEKSRLLKVGEQVLRTAIDEMGRCDHWSQVAAAMEQVAAEAGFSLVEQFVGHGIGREMHEDPQVPNYVSPSLRQQDFAIRPGLVLAVEPMVNAGSKGVRVLSDHWTAVTDDGRPSVHFEHTIAVTADGPILLTEGVGEFPADDD